MEVDLGSWIGQVGVGGIFLILVLKMVLEFVEKYRAKHDPESAVGRTTGEHQILEKKLMVIMGKLDQVEKQIDDLWVWHNKEDGDGRKIWYFSSSLTAALEKLAASLDKQTQVLTEVAREQRQVIEGQKQMIDKMSKLTGDLPRMRESSRG